MNLSEILSSMHLSSFCYSVVLQLHTFSLYFLYTLNDKIGYIFRNIQFFWIVLKILRVHNCTINWQQIELVMASSALYLNIETKIPSY